MQYDYVMSPNIVFDAGIDRDTWKGEGHVTLTIDTVTETAKWSWYRDDDMTLNEYDVPLGYEVAMGIVLGTFARAERDA
jgi:hypothetical protein